jgi:hypothetical protein
MQDAGYSSLNSLGNQLYRYSLSRVAATMVSVPVLLYSAWLEYRDDSTGMEVEIL